MTCELVARRDRGEAPLWDRIVRTAQWDVVHAFGTAVGGWLVLVARRHITSIADMTDDEAAELGPLIREVSRAVQCVLDCDKTYVAQSSTHSIRTCTFTSSRAVAIFPATYAEKPEDVRAAFRPGTAPPSARSGAPSPHEH